MMRGRTPKKVKPHLPALNRHAQALSGGDGARLLVERTLANLKRRDYAALQEREVRTRLFRDFHDLYLSADATDGAGNGAARKAQLDRCGLLLRHVQGFSVQDTATILRRDVLPLQARLDAAYAELHGGKGRDVLLVEDDPVLANGLTDMIESLGHRVLGVARNPAEALVATRSIRVDAIVADLNNAERDAQPEAKSMMERLLDVGRTPIVMVAPALDAASATEPYVVATPFQVAELKVVLSQALFNQSAGVA
jgi:CheY-like chemotaxis protein